MAEGRGNQGPRGTEAVIKHLQGLSSDLLDRTCIHTSKINKIGIKPGENITTDNLEPVGIYAYRARRWLKVLGNVPYRGFPYLHVITLRPGIKQASIEETKQLALGFEREVLGHSYDDGEAAGASGGFTKYLIGKGYGTVSQVKDDGFTEIIILGRQFIERTRTFDAYHLPPGTEKDDDDGVATFGYDRARTGLGRHAAWLEAHPRIAQILGIDDSWNLNNRGPDEFSRIRLILNALRTGTWLSAKQEKWLVLPHATHTEDRYRYLDAYREIAHLMP